MQRDKAALLYQGKSQLDRAFELAARHVDRVFVSVRAGQDGGPGARAPAADRRFGRRRAAPSSASARRSRPTRTSPGWCSPAICRSWATPRSRICSPSAIPSLGHRVSQRARRPAGAAVRRVGTQGRGPRSLRTRRQAGSCPRKFLMRHAVQISSRWTARARQRQHARGVCAGAQAARLAAEVNPMQLKIQYYALMREQAGRSEETVETTAATPADLYSRAARRAMASPCRANS